jgi:hypothetical protein
VQDSPDERVLVIQYFSSYGLVKGRDMRVVMNEFDAKTNFYRCIDTSKSSIDAAKKHPNMYILDVYACEKATHDPRVQYKPSAG